MHFVVNYLAHFALATGLHSALASDGAARIVVVSSMGHLYAPLVFDDIHFAFRPYDPYGGYRQSKTAVVLFAVEATKHWTADGITANACNPGAIKTNLTSHIDTTGVNLDAYRWKTPEQGAATSVLLATSPLLEGVGGRYFEECNEAIQVTNSSGQRGVAPYALDPNNANRLWDVSLDLLNNRAHPDASQH
jgi:NAD(P)-dependent dehydrogenase (short-subunit alcohol dehydrogenase family)